MRASRCAVASSPLLAQLAISPAATTTTGSPVVCLVLCCAPVCRVASVACSALRRGAPCLEVCFGVASCEPQPTARRIAKARIPTAIGATLLIVPMATIPSPLLSSRVLSTAISARTRLHDGRIRSGTPAPPPARQASQGHERYREDNGGGRPPDSGHVPPVGAEASAET